MYNRNREVLLWRLVQHSDQSVKHALKALGLVLQLQLHQLRHRLRREQEQLSLRQLPLLVPCSRYVSSIVFPH